MGTNKIAISPYDIAFPRDIALASTAPMQYPSSKNPMTIPKYPKFAYGSAMPEEPRPIFELAAIGSNISVIQTLLRYVLSPETFLAVVPMFGINWEAAEAYE